MPDAANPQERELQRVADIWRVVWTDARLTASHVVTLGELLRGSGYDPEEVRRVAGTDA